MRSRSLNRPGGSRSSSGQRRMLISRNELRKWQGDIRPPSIRMSGKFSISGRIQRSKRFRCAGGRRPPRRQRLISGSDGQLIEILLRFCGSGRMRSKPGTSQTIDSFHSARTQKQSPDTYPGQATERSIEIEPLPSGLSSTGAR